MIWPPCPCARCWHAIQAWTGPPSTKCCMAAPTRPVKTTATWRAWPPCWPDCRKSWAPRPSTACAAPAWTPSAAPRPPFYMGNADTAFSRQAALQDTTIGWRFVNPLMAQLYGVDSMPQTAENVATDYRISRADQDRFALRSQDKAARAQSLGRFDEEIVAVEVAQKKGAPLLVARDEHPRATTIDTLAALKPVVHSGGTITAGNASGVNDGACALLLASEAAADRHGLVPRARVVGMATAGVAPRVVGIGPAPAVLKVLQQTGLTLGQIDLIELNEAFAAQGLAVLRLLGVADDDARVNPYGGAIALGHPLGMSGARLVTTALYQLHRMGGRYALCTMCIGVGQGIAIVIERV